MKAPTVLVAANPEEGLGALVSRALPGARVLSGGEGKDASERWDLAIVEAGPEDVLRRLRELEPELPVILWARAATEELATVAIEHDAWLVWTRAQLGPVLARAARHADALARRRKAQDFNDGQRQVLEAIARATPLRDVLRRIVLLIEAQNEGMLGSIVLVESRAGRRVIARGAAPNLPAEYSSMVDGLEIGPTVGSCGAAAYHGARVIASDIANHPNWRTCRHLALAHGLRACWSTPIFSPSKEVLGTFAMYYREVHEPSEEELELAQAAAHLAAVAILRERAEQEIAWQASLLDRAKDAILVRGLDGAVLSWNEGAARLYGWMREEVLGRSVLEFLVQDHAQFEAAQAELLERGEFSGELHRVARSGRRLTVDSRWTLLRDLRGQPKAVLAIDTDVTAKKDLESQLRRKQRLESLGTLAGGIAHDFNNLLTAILGNLEAALYSLPSDAPEREALLDVRVAAERAAQLSKQILMFSRQGSARRAAMNVRPVLQEVLRLLRSTLPPAVELRADFARDAPRIRGDAGQLHRVVMNLCTNAAQAMGDGPGTLSVLAEAVDLDAAAASALSGLKEGRHLHLAVSDTGCGMDASTLEHVFEPFFTTKAPGEGTGLGLSVVHGIIEGHEGAIVARSEPGEGTTFDLYFPAAMDPEEESAGEPEPRLEQAPGGGRRILYVDDEPAVLRTVARVLGTLGYSVTGMEDPAEALSTFLARPRDFDAVVSDVAMPKMSGVDFARRVRETSADIPLVLISGNFRAEVAQEARRLGVAELVYKPDASELGRALQRIFQEA